VSGFVLLGERRRRRGRKRSRKREEGSPPLRRAAGLGYCILRLISFGLYSPVFR
jgi:hypothetical protein